MLSNSAPSAHPPQIATCSTVPTKLEDGDVSYLGNCPQPLSSNPPPVTLDKTWHDIVMQSVQYKQNML